MEEMTPRKVTETPDLSEVTSGAQDLPEMELGLLPEVDWARLALLLVMLLLALLLSYLIFKRGSMSGSQSKPTVSTKS